MHFDPRTQRALREAGLDAGAIADASDRVAELVAEDADRLRAFFAADGPYYSDMELAHSTAETQEHPTADVDLFTHGSDLRGYLSLDGWGVPVEGGRVLRTAAADGDADEGSDGGGGDADEGSDGGGGDADEGSDGDDGGESGEGSEDAAGDGIERPGLVELSLGETIHGRVRFARDPEEL